MDPTGLASYLVATAYSLVWMAKLLPIQEGYRAAGTKSLSGPLPIIPKQQPDAPASSRSHHQTLFCPNLLDCGGLSGDKYG